MKRSASLTLVHVHLPAVDLDDAPSGLFGRVRQFDLAIQPPRPQQRRVQNVRPVRCRDHLQRPDQKERHETRAVCGAGLFNPFVSFVRLRVRTSKSSRGQINTKGGIGEGQGGGAIDEGRNSPPDPVAIQKYMRDKTHSHAIDTYYSSKTCTRACCGRILLRGKKLLLRTNRVFGRSNFANII